jgi:hypothetical protein
MKREPVTHDYTSLSWGHNITFISISPDGTRARVICHGHGVRHGDFLILPSHGSTTRYRVAAWEQKRPSDCWAADIEFAPRAVEVAL